MHVAAVAEKENFGRWRAMNDYGDDDDEGAVQQTKKLAFVLSQLRDDWDCGCSHVV